LPRAINCNARPQRITTVSILPAGIEPNDVRNEPLIMYPGGIQSKRQFITKMGYGRGSRTVVFAIFDRDDICDALETEGQHQVRVAGWLQSGRCFCGADRITIVTPKSHRWPFRRFYP
jgi:hypothetical protein